MCGREKTAMQAVVRLTSGPPSPYTRKLARLLMIGVQARPVKSGSGTAPGRPGDQGARRHRATSEGSAGGGTHATLAHRSPTVRPST